MTDLFGNYQSQSTRQLTRIDSTKYPDTNEDFEANIKRLNSFVDYISQYLQQMQKGVDQAAQDPISRLRDTVTNLGVLLGGGELLYGIDLGDLQYMLPALGALFGFDSSQPFPINLFEAVEHFFLGYIIPLDSWNVAVEGIIDGWMTALGLNQDFIDAVHLVLDNMGRFTGDLLTLFNDATGLLGVFNIFDFVNGPIGPIWSALSGLLSNFNVANLGTITDPFLETLTPWLQALGEILGTVDDFLEAFSSGLDTSGLGGLSNITGWLTDLLGIFGGITGLGTGSPSITDPLNIPILSQIPLLNNVINLLPGLSNNTIDPFAIWRNIIAQFITGLPASNVLGIQGISDIGSVVQNTWNYLTIALGGATNPVNATQQINIGGSPTSGLFQLISPIDNTQVTSTLPITATATQITTALEALSSIGSGNVSVTGGPLMTAPINTEFIGALANKEFSLIGHIDNLIGGVNPAVAINHQSIGGDAAYLPDLAMLLQQQAENALGAIDIAVDNQNKLGIRNNRPLFNAIHPMAEGSHNIASGGRINVAATATSAPMAFQVIDKDVAKSFVQAVANKTGTVTSFVLNIAKVDASGDLHNVYTSPDLSAQLGATNAWITSSFGSNIQMLAGEAYGVEGVVTGSGTVNILGQVCTDVPLHPTAIPKHPAASRNPTGNLSPATIVSAALGYGTNQPFFSIGTGVAPPPYIPPQTQQFSTSGNNTIRTYTIPDFARISGAKIDVVLNGGGGGGQGEQGFNLGQGGYAGVWADVTLTCGIDYPVGATTISFIVGRGGPQQITYFSNGINGSQSSITWNDGVINHTIAAAGGVGGHGAGFGYNGQGSGNHSYRGINYPGGTDVSPGAKGSAPGGGGGGAPPYLFGGGGADGTVIFIARQL